MNNGDRARDFEGFRSRQPAVVGVGTTPFGSLPEHSADGLAVWALRESLEDSGLSPKDIDGLIVSRANCQSVAFQSGIEPRWVAELPPQGRMAGVAIQLAADAIRSGRCERVALAYGNDGKSRGAKYGGTGEAYGSSQQMNEAVGMTSPGAYYALMFQRHCHEFGTTSDQLATIPMTFRHHAMLNPHAVMRRELSRDDYHNSRYIVAPLHLYDYCLINDGGVALIITKESLANDAPKPPVRVLGYGQQAQFLESEYVPRDFWRDALRRITQDAFRMADVTHADIDGLMAYDNFSPNVLFTLEGMGFCEVGGSGDWIQNGRIGLEGELPLNTSGGHLSESYMQGWALNVEAVRQLRRECGSRQIKDAEVIQYACAAPLTSTVIYGR